MLPPDTANRPDEAGQAGPLFDWGRSQSVSHIRTKPAPAPRTHAASDHFTGQPSTYISRRIRQTNVAEALASFIEKMCEPDRRERIAKTRPSRRGVGWGPCLIRISKALAFTLWQLSEWRLWECCLTL
jgi:hypothetical protein